MNLSLKDILKGEFQKLLDVGFIYPILDSEWVSPLVIVPNKNEKWRIYVDYRELNKATRKDHFPFPFTDQALVVFAMKNFVSCLDVFIKYNQNEINHEDQDKTPSSILGRLPLTNSFHLSYEISPSLFKGLHLASYMVSYMIWQKFTWMTSHPMEMISKKLSPS